MGAGMKVVFSSINNGANIQDKSMKGNLLETVVGKAGELTENSCIGPGPAQFAERSSRLNVLINASNCANQKTEMMTNGYITGLSLLRVNPRA